MESSKKSFDCCVYESVELKSRLGYVSKTDEKQNSGTKGLKKNRGKLQRTKMLYITRTEFYVEILTNCFTISQILLTFCFEFNQKGL